MDFDGSIEVPADEEVQQWTLALPARAGVYLLWGDKHQAILLANSGSVRAAVRRKLSGAEDETPNRRTRLADITKGVSWMAANSSFVSYWQFHQLARQIYILSILGESEQKACKRILDAFEEYARSKPSLF